MQIKHKDEIQWHDLPYIEDPYFAAAHVQAAFYDRGRWHSSGLYKLLGGIYWKEPPARFLNRGRKALSQLLTWLEKGEIFVVLNGFDARPKAPMVCSGSDGPELVPGNRVVSLSGDRARLNLEWVLARVVPPVAARTVATKAEEPDTPTEPPAEEPLMNENLVTPRLLPEYNVVLCDRGLSDYQHWGETRLSPTPTHILLSVTQSNKSLEPYEGNGWLSCSRSDIQFYEDELCTKEVDLSQPIEAWRISGERPLTLYIKAARPGKFMLKFSLEDPGKPKVRIKQSPIEQEMGAVELNMTLHEQDIDALKQIQIDPDTDPIEAYHDRLRDQPLPAQTPMTDEDKIDKGRLLHVQADGSFGRAKLVINKLVAGHWPADAGNYEVVINASGGGLELFNAEWEGRRLSLPLRVKVSDLKHEALTVWVQGKTASKQARDAILDIGIDRPAGRTVKQPKRYGDWCHFTVARIEKVAVDYIREQGKALAWEEGDDKTEPRFYINLQEYPQGRVVTIGAQLSEKIADATVHFMLVPDENNRKRQNWGVDMPDTWKWHEIPRDLKHNDKQDCTDILSDNRKDFLHASAMTDENGYATANLVLSRFGGDKFHPACYLEQDPHLAKYVHGHQDLAKRRPVVAEKPVTVWRKFWYQITQPKGFSAPRPTMSEAAYERVFARMEYDQTVEYGEQDAPAGTLYKEYIITGGDSERMVVVAGSHNKHELAKKLIENDEQPVKNHLILCDHQYDAGLGRTAWGVSGPIKSLPSSEVKISMTLPVFDPPLDGGRMVKQLYWYRSSSPGTINPIPTAQATIPKPRTDSREIAVELPKISPPPSASDPVYIHAVCSAPDGPYLGESFGKHSLIVFIPTEAAAYQDTVVHEIGHAFNQTPRLGMQPGAPAIPSHPAQADRGQGNHCQVNDGVDKKTGEIKYKCVMYDAGPMKWGLHRFCDTCHPYLLAEELYKP